MVRFLDAKQFWKNLTICLKNYPNLNFALNQMGTIQPRNKYVSEISTLRPYSASRNFYIAFIKKLKVYLLHGSKKNQSVFPIQQIHNTTKPKEPADPPFKVNEKHVETSIFSLCFDMSMRCAGLFYSSLQFKYMHLNFSK